MEMATVTEAIRVKKGYKKPALKIYDKCTAHSPHWTTNSKFHNLHEPITPILPFILWLKLINACKNDYHELLLILGLFLSSSLRWTLHEI